MGVAKAAVGGRLGAAVVCCGWCLLIPVKLQGDKGQQLWNHSYNALLLCALDWTTTGDETEKRFRPQRIGGFGRRGDGKESEKRMMYVAEKQNKSQDINTGVHTHKSSTAAARGNSPLRTLTSRVEAR